MWISKSDYQNLVLENEHLRQQNDSLVKENQRMTALLNTPEVENFGKGVVLEAQHQRFRWGEDHDAQKRPENWFWTLGYLSGKLLRAALVGDRDKALHHCISSAALLANWHAAIGGHRPGKTTMPEFGEPHAVEKMAYRADVELHGEQAFLLWEYRKNPHVSFTQCFQSPAWAVAHEYRRVSQDPDVPLGCSGDPNNCPDNEGYGCYCGTGD